MALRSINYEKLVTLTTPSVNFVPGRFLSIVFHQWERDTLGFGPYICFLPRIQSKMASDDEDWIRFIA